ncbi:MAG: hypothetical protein JW839_10700 [Candidatus Lokiarchaeota archaeon]|nr:hypothetical protein [Candidatus Lokiarchaeota archaeon]
MLPAIEDLRGKELAFATIAAKLHDQEVGTTDDTLVQEFAAATGGYSRAINDALKAYASIDYSTEPTVKVRSKALIGYAYDFLALLVDIVRVMEASPTASTEVARRLDLLEDFLLQKESLISSTYVDAARRELAAFHDPSVRGALEERLARLLRDRTGGQDGRR